jgi:polysaccharide biosynthesis transport protein
MQDITAELDSARQRYSADHPDVMRLQRSLDTMQQQATEEQSADTPKVEAESPDNPAYIQIRAQREASFNERAALLGKKNELARLISDFDRREAQAPDVERQYRAMLSEIDGNQQKYHEVRQKQMEAEVAENLEDERKGERFTLIEPPFAAGRPYSPNRVVMLGLGMFLAMGASFGLAVLIELFDTRIRSRRDLELLLQVPPLAVIPWIDTDSDKHAKQKTLKVAAAGAVVSFILAATAAHFLYKPLDVLWQVILRRLTG